MTFTLTQIYLSSYLKLLIGVVEAQTPLVPVWNPSRWVKATSEHPEAKEGYWLQQGPSH